MYIHLRGNYVTCDLPGGGHLLAVSLVGLQGNLDHLKGVDEDGLSDPRAQSSQGESLQASNVSTTPSVCCSDQGLTSGVGEEAPNRKNFLYCSNVKN